MTTTDQPGYRYRVTPVEGNQYERTVTTRKAGMRDIRTLTRYPNRSLAEGAIVELIRPDGEVDTRWTIQARDAKREKVAGEQVIEAPYPTSLWTEPFIDREGVVHPSREVEVGRVTDQRLYLADVKRASTYRSGDQDYVDRSRLADVGSARRSGGGMMFTTRDGAWASAIAQTSRDLERHSEGLAFAKAQLAAYMAAKP